MMLTLAVLFAALVAQTPQASSPPKRPSRPPVPQVAADVLAQFDFLDGEWEFVYTTAGPDGQQGVANGTWHGRKLADGVVEDRWSVVGPDGKAGAGIYTFRAYNRLTGQWQYRSVNATTGVWQEGTAEKAGSEMHLLQQPPKERPNGTMLRIRYYDISPTHFSWSADASGDGGQTWQPNVSHMEAKRPATAAK